MDQIDETIDLAIGARIKALRSAIPLTLDELAERSGVSRAMISRIERGESSATAQLLVRLCVGLDVTLSSLFARSQAEPSPLSRFSEQVTWRDPASGYVRRAVSPATVEGIVDLVEVVLPPGGLVPFDRQPHSHADQLVWVLDGNLEMTAGDDIHPLSRGDCLHMRLDKPVIFRNPGPEAVRYAVILSHGRMKGGR